MNGRLPHIASMNRRTGTTYVRGVKSSGLKSRTSHHGERGAGETVFSKLTPLSFGSRTPAIEVIS